MKFNKILAAGLLSAALSTSAFAQAGGEPVETGKVITLTGATAFRAASHAAIANALQNVQYGWTGNQNLSGADRAIFRGTLNGEVYTILTSWSGSGSGVKALLDQAPVEVLDPETPLEGNGQIAAPAFKTAVAKFSFSDVAQEATEFPEPTLQAVPVGVVPFMFVANKSAVGTGFTNVSTQQFDTLYSTGYAPLSMFTGNPEHENVEVIPTGRASSSGTRITVLAETGYGINRALTQWNIPAGTGPITNADTQTEFAPKAGYSSNSFIRNIVLRDSAPGAPIVFGYLTVSDATAAIAGGAQGLSYNGVEYSEENVKTGKYTLWGYQQFFNVQGLDGQETAFKNALLAAIPQSLDGAGIGIPDMLVERQGGEGGPIIPR